MPEIAPTGFESDPKRLAETAAQTGAKAAEKLAETATMFQSSAERNAVGGNPFSAAIANGPSAFPIMAEIGGIMAEGAQDLTRTWLEWIESGLKRNSEHLSGALGARSAVDLMLSQANLARENLESIVDTATRASDVSLRTAERVARRLAPERPGA